jgi:hypothetical protein
MVPCGSDIIHSFQLNAAGAHLAVIVASVFVYSSRFSYNVIASTGVEADSQVTYGSEGFRVLVSLLVSLTHASTHLHLFFLQVRGGGILVDGPEPGVSQLVFVNIEVSGNVLSTGRDTGVIQFQVRDDFEGDSPLGSLTSHEIAFADLWRWIGSGEWLFVSLQFYDHTQCH